MRDWHNQTMRKSPNRGAGSHKLAFKVPNACICDPAQEALHQQAAKHLRYFVGDSKKEKGFRTIC
jgi:hypothetical protein